jgi:signal peptidase I
MAVVTLPARPPAPVPVPVAGATSVAEQERAPSLRRLLIGSLGRVWVWFLVGCLTITVLPLLVGWSSYLIETGSMRPSIRPGDVVITSPNPDLDQLGGRVITFDSPSVDGQVVTHRVVEIADDGRMRTKGDANPSADSATITLDSVRGMGRLLVKYVGLPKVWWQEREVLPLALFLLSLLAAAAAIRWDRDDDAGDADRSGDDDPKRQDAPGDSDHRQVRWPRPTSSVVFVALVLLGTTVLTVPTAMAAMSAQTRSTGSTWSVPQWSYPQAVLDLLPMAYYRFEETNSGKVVADASGNKFNGKYVGSVVKGLSGPLTSEPPNRAVRLNSSDACVTMQADAKLTPAPTTFSITTWFSVPVGYDRGGKLAGFESTMDGVTSSSTGVFDRHLYLDGSGRVRFGVRSGGSPVVVTSSAAYNDGQWHLAAATFGPGGMRLYLDGALVGQSATSSAAIYPAGGWWRFGCGNLAGWGTTTGPAPTWSGPNAPSADANRPVLGSIDEVAVWNGRVLTAEEISFLMLAR